MNLQDLENLLKEVRAAIAPGGELIEFTESDFADFEDFEDEDTSRSRPTSRPTYAAVLRRERRERRDRLLKIWLTASEEMRLKEISYSHGTTKARYARARIFGLPVPRSRSRSIVPQVNRETYIQLARIGGNLNQQTRAIDRAIAHGEGVDKSMLFECRQQLETLSELIRQVRLELISGSSGESDDR
ncbi:MAG: hypothetical protein D6694_09135 [Gammaproteobacteria bacterium]|nr:MAG: hypothetical protein D6694_09135 [Gammaproteobacteria bacterium]